MGNEDPIFSSAFFAICPYYAAINLYKEAGSSRLVIRFRLQVVVGCVSKWFRWWVWKVRWKDPSFTQAQSDRAEQAAARTAYKGANFSVSELLDSKPVGSSIAHGFSSYCEGFLNFLSLLNSPGHFALFLAIASLPGVFFSQNFSGNQ